MRRRTFGTLVASTLTTGGILALTSRKSSAMQVSVDNLDVADDTIPTSQPINSLNLSLSGSYSWDTVEVPTRALIRVHLSYNGTTEQIAATDLGDSFTAQDSGTYAFPRIALTDHSALAVSDVTPATVGDSNTFDFTLAVTLAAYSADGKIGETSISDTSTLTVSRTKVQLNGSLDGSGNYSVETETPS